MVVDFCRDLFFLCTKHASASKEPVYSIPNQTYSKLKHKGSAIFAPQNSFEYVTTYIFASSKISRI